MAIRRRSRNHFGGNIGGSPWPVLNDERVAEPFRQPLTEESPVNIAPATSGESNYDAYRSGWISLCLRHAERGRESGRAGNQLQEMATRKLHCALSESHIALVLNALRVDLKRFGVLPLQILSEGVCEVGSRRFTQRGGIELWVNFNDVLPTGGQCKNHQYNFEHINLPLIAACHSTSRARFLPNGGMMLSQLAQAPIIR